MTDKKVAIVTGASVGIGRAAFETQLKLVF
jgi:NAD(P)-dependent dehydrogenase (short-subunit alcohol dehydrogenase family)